MARQAACREMAEELARHRKQAARVARLCDPVKHPESISPAPVGRLDEPRRVVDVSALGIGVEQGIGEPADGLPGTRRLPHRNEHVGARENGLDHHAMHGRCAQAGGFAVATRKRQDGVKNLIAHKLADLTSLLGGLATTSRDFH